MFPVLRYLHTRCIFAFNQCLHLSLSFVNWLQIATLSGKSRRSVGSFPNVAHMFATPSCRISCSSWSEAWSILLDHRNFLLYCSPSVFFDVEISILQRLTDLSRLPVAQSLILLQSLPSAWCLMMLKSPLWCLFEILLTQFFTPGVASSFVFWWMHCVAVHVGILVVQFLRDHCGAMNCPFVSRLQRQRNILRHVCSCGKIRDSKPQKRLTNCFGKMSCASWCWPGILNFVSASVEWSYRLPTAVLCWRIWLESLDLNWARCVRDLWRSVGRLLSFVCFTAASSSSKMYVAVGMLNSRTWCYGIWVCRKDLESLTACECKVSMVPTNSTLECISCVTVHVKCSAKSASWNNPSLQSAWFPTWQYRLFVVGCVMKVTYDMKRASRNSNAWLHFMIDIVAWFTVQSELGLHMLAKYKHLRTTGRNSLKNLTKFSRFSGFNYGRPNEVWKPFEVCQPHCAPIRNSVQHTSERVFPCRSSKAVMEFFSSVFTSVFVLRSIENHFCFSITTLLLTFAARWAVSRFSWSSNDVGSSTSTLFSNVTYIFGKLKFFLHGSDSDLSPSMLQWSSMVASWSTSMLVLVCLWTSINFSGI